MIVYEVSHDTLEVSESTLEARVDPSRGTVYTLETYEEAVRFAMEEAADRIGHYSRILARFQDELEMLSDV